jgi:hypothetical protein
VRYSKYCIKETCVTFLEGEGGGMIPSKTIEMLLNISGKTKAEGSAKEVQQYICG